MKRKTVILFFVLVMVCFFTPIPDTYAGASGKIITYYFHGTNRCRTCLKIEELTKITVNTHFQDELKKGRLQWQPVNIDLPENKHFVEDYNLYTRSVVVVDMRGEKVSRWKNLERIWQLVSKEDVFKQYIQKEVAAYLKGE